MFRSHFFGKLLSPLQSNLYRYAALTILRRNEVTKEQEAYRCVIRHIFSKSFFRSLTCISTTSTVRRSFHLRRTSLNDVEITGFLIYGRIYNQKKYRSGTATTFGVLLSITMPQDWQYSSSEISVLPSREV